MATGLQFRWGESIDNPTVEQMQRALAELDVEDGEHPSCWLVHEDSSWVLDAYEGGRLIWDELENPDPKPRHMNDVSRAEVLRLWQLLAAGELAKIESLPWRPGYY
ncbi:MAG: hypothetical protein Q8L55_09485 [Phycisphaerales bacterium]|nr:hypothetical protein [Phycisphaerales bacterium]